MDSNSSESFEWPSNISGLADFDFSFVCNVVGGDKEDANWLLQQFLSNTYLIEDIEKVAKIDPIDLQKLQLASHTLKGSASFFNAEKIIKLSEIIQMACEEKNLKVVNEHLPLLFQAYKLTSKIVEDFLKTPKK